MSRERAKTMSCGQQMEKRVLRVGVVVWGLMLMMVVSVGEAGPGVKAQTSSESENQKTSPVQGRSQVGSQSSQKEDHYKKLRQWQQRLAASRDLSLQWTQKQYKALRNRTTTHTGKAYFRLPHTFFWDMASQKQAWLFNGRELMYVDYPRQRVLSYPARARQGREFLRFIGLVTQFEDLTQEFEIASLQEGKKLLELTLTPKHKGDLVRVHVKYLRASAFIHEIRMEFASKNHTTIAFSGHSRAPLAAKVFQVPVGMQVEKMQLPAVTRKKP